MSEQTPNDENRPRDEFDNMARDEHGNYIASGMGGMLVITYSAEDVARFRENRRSDEAQRAIATLTRRSLFLERPCEKCGNVPVANTTDKTRRNATLTYSQNTEQHWAPRFGSGECIIRTCRRCGYRLAEQCTATPERTNDREQ